MTASPLEARCSVCLDTGSKSQDADGHQDCTACDAVERRAEVLGYLRELSPYMSSYAKAWAAYLFAQRQAAPVAAQPALPKLPSTPEEVVAFIGSNFTCLYDAGPVEDHDYTMSVHDLLSCFQNLADFAEVASQPADPDDMAANYDHSTHDKRMEVLKGLRAAQEPKQAMTDADIHEIMAKHVDCSYAEGLAFARAIIRASSPNKELAEALREIIANDPFNVHNSGIIARAALRAAGVEVAS